MDKVLSPKSCHNYAYKWKTCMNYNRMCIRSYKVEPQWLKENFASIGAGKGPLRLCWWRGLTTYVVNLETRRYRLLSDWSYIHVDNKVIQFQNSIRCKRNGVKGCLTVHFTDSEGCDDVLKIDEELHIRSKRGV